jgi:hypothetical protein
MTRGSARTTSGGPSAMTRPNSSTSRDRALLAASYLGEAGGAAS